MNQEQNHGPSKVRHLAPILAGLVIVVIIGWIVMNSNPAGPPETANPANGVLRTLNNASDALTVAAETAKQIDDNHLVSGWRRMESYVINRQESMFQSPDAPKMYSEHLSLLIQFVEQIAAIAVNLNSLPEGSIGPALLTDVTAFDAYSLRLTERLDALTHSVETGDALPSVVPAPKAFAASITAEIERLEAP